MIYGQILKRDNIPISWNKASSTDNLYGAMVSTGNWMRYLLEYGTFDEYHFFVSSTSPEAVEYWQESIKDFPGRERAKVKDILELAIALKNEHYTLFHDPSTPFFIDLAYLRSQFQGPHFPITSLIHSISYQFIVSEIVFTLLSELYPFDSIVCSGSDARTVFQSRFEQVSNYLEKKYGIEKKYPGRFDYIPLGVDSRIFRPRNKKDVRTLLDLPQDKTIILCFARLSAHEKMDLLPLLRSFKEVLGKHPNEKPVLLFAGEDKRYGYASEVKNFAQNLGIENSVLFKTNPSFVDQPLIYSASNIFVSPVDNIQENFGTTIIEAMASGLPVVASDWDGYKDTIVHCKTGFRIPTCWMPCDDRLCQYSPIMNWRLEHLFIAQSVSVDMDKMTEYLSLLVENKELRKKFGEAGRERVLSKFDWKVIVKQYEELWQELYQMSQEYEVPPPQRKTSLLRPARFESFQSYPTFTVEDDMQLSITEYGREILDKKAPLNPYRGMNKVLLFPAIQDILGSASANGPVPIGEIVNTLAQKYQKYGISKHDIRYRNSYLLPYLTLGTLDTFFTR